MGLVWECTLIHLWNGGARYYIVTVGLFVCLGFSCSKIEFYDVYIKFICFSCVKQKIKYGVVSMQDLAWDVLTWEKFYLSGRLQKPVR